MRIKLDPIKASNIFFGTMAFVAAMASVFEIYKTETSNNFQKGANSLAELKSLPVTSTDAQKISDHLINANSLEESVLAARDAGELAPEQALMVFEQSTAKTDTYGETVITEANAVTRIAQTAPQFKSRVSVLFLSLAKGLSKQSTDLLETNYRSDAYKQQAYDKVTITVAFDASKIGDEKTVQYLIKNGTPAVRRAIAPGLASLFGKYPHYNVTYNSAYFPKSVSATPS